MVSLRTELLEPLAAEGERHPARLLRAAWPTRPLEWHRRDEVRVATPDLPPLGATLRVLGQAWPAELLNLTETGVGLGLRQAPPFALQGEVQVDTLLPGGMALHLVGDVRHSGRLDGDPLPVRLGLVLRGLPGEMREALRRDDPGAPQHPIRSHAGGGVAMRHIGAVLCVACLGLAGQTVVKPFQASPAASVSQELGLCSVRIDYHRPAVRGRRIWGGVVPYGEVWRAGANEATTLALSDPVQVDGHPLAAGTYAFFAIPGPDQWTLIFNRTARQWGAFSYQPAQDALRVQVKPRQAPAQEYLGYTIQVAGPDSLRVELAWDTLAVGFDLAMAAHDRYWDYLQKALAAAGPEEWQPLNQGAELLPAERHPPGPGHGLGGPLHRHQAGLPEPVPEGPAFEAGGQGGRGQGDAGEGAAAGVR